MAFSRNSLAAAFAGTLSLAVLTGCPAQTPGGTGTPSVAPTTAPTTAPTATTAPTTAPTTPASGGPTVAPSVTPSMSPLAPTTLQGKVYDEAGALISTGAKVVIKSLNPSNPFETTLDVVNGNYVANNVPAGVLVEVTAMRDNWTSRTQVATLLPLNTASQGNTVNFGGAQNPYFISKYPEITSVEPADEATLADPSKLVYKLTLSEALDSDNRNRFASALRVWPANTNAAANNVGNLNTETADLQETTPASLDLGAAGSTGGFGTYAAQSPAREGTPFLTASNVASVTWDASGKVATFTFNAPVKASTAGKARYAVGLTGTDLATGTVIQDSENNPLGMIAGAATDATAAFGGYTGQLFITNAFRKPDLPVLPADATADSAAERWALTHDNVAEFDVAEDDTAPTLASVTITGRNIFTLTFSEPMVAAAGSAISSSVSNTTQYLFQAADTESEVGNDAEIDDASGPSAAVAGGVYTTPSLAAIDNQTDFENKVFTFDPAAFEVIADENDPKVLRIRRQGILANPNGEPATDRLDATKIKFVRVKVLSSVQDPAGNAITTSNDASIKTVTL